MKVNNRLSEFLQFTAYLLSNEDYSKMPYGQYLNTYHWNLIRKEKLHSVNHRCQVCNGTKKLQVHHRTYERLGKEQLIDLTVLCQECHELFHKHSKLKKS